MSYLDHRDKRIKEQRLKPMDFILQHVPPKELHVIRYYGLYASASKLQYERCQERNSTLEPMPRTSSADPLSMIVYCKTFGEPVPSYRRWWSRRSKGISINKEALSNCVSGSAQQVYEPPFVGGFYNTS